MRTTFGLAITAASMIAIGAVVTGQAPSTDAKAATVLASARKALGGEQKLAALKSLSLRGTYQREASAPSGGGGAVFISMMGPGPAGSGPPPQMTGELEIDVAFPANYIKVDVGTGMMAMGAMTRTEGYEGDRPFMDMSSSQPGMRIIANRPTDDPAAKQGALRRSREELARLLLGLVAGTQPSFPVTYTYAGQAESPDGRADVLDVKGPDGFAARLFVDAQSHLPLMLTYVAPEARMVMRTSTDARPPLPANPHGGNTVVRTPEGMSPEERAQLDKTIKDAEAAPAKMIEYRLFFTDFREVDGLSLPHHIARGTAEKTTEEWEIKGYKVNPSLKADRFKVGS